MIAPDKLAFFDEIAPKWDGWEDPEQVVAGLREGLRALGVGSDEVVLDLGCGTGNLTLALLAHLSARGRVVALDPSSGMLARARAKVQDARVRWLRAAAECVDLADASVDRVIAFSMWPHVERPEQATRELRRVLRPGGWLHVWHTSSRARINDIHAHASPAVHDDLLPPAADLAALLEGEGFEITSQTDDDAGYLVSARSPGAGSPRP